MSDYLPEWELKFDSSNDCDKILHYVCALRNDETGGRLILGPIKKSDLVRSLEQKLEALDQPLLFEIEMEFDELNRFVLTIPPGNSLFTISSGIYSPTQAQVIEIDPNMCLPKIRELLAMNRRKAWNLSKVDMELKNVELVATEKTNLRESDMVQLKNFKTEPGSSTKLSDRIKRNSSKLLPTLSAFANRKGGTIYFGISDDSTVAGHDVSKTEKNKIERQIEKEIKKMIWPLHCDQLQRGDHWDISFLKVKDKDGKEIPSRFVIAVTVAPCPGGVFAAKPKSFRIHDGKLEEMSFESWRNAVLSRSRVGMAKEERHTGMTIADDHQRLHSTPARASRLHMNYMQITQHQDCLRENGKWDQFQHFNNILARKSKSVNVQLMLTFQYASAAAMKVCKNEAKHMLMQYQKLVNSTDVSPVFRLDDLYLQVKIQGCEGNIRESFEICLSALAILEMMPVTLNTAWFYYLIAVHVTIFAQERADNAQEQRKLLQFADRAATKAIQQAQQLDCVSTASSYLRQAIHVHLAMFYLDSALNGRAIFDARRINNVDIAKAENVLSHLEENSLSQHNRCELLIAKTDLWIRKGHLSGSKRDEQQCFEKALSFSRQACYLARGNLFNELHSYSRKRESALSRSI